MRKPLISLAALCALTAPAIAQDEQQGAPSPNEIVAQAAADEWVAIPPEDLLVMTLAPDAAGKERKVIIQLMPAPFSQGWVDNIRTLARAKWYDDITVNRVQDNYVVQWGDLNYDNPEAKGEPKLLPAGLKVMGEGAYLVDVNTLADAEAGYADAESALEAELGEPSPDPRLRDAVAKLDKILSNPNSSEVDHEQAIAAFLKQAGLSPLNEPSESELRAMISIRTTQTSDAPEGWHQRDSYAPWVEFWRGWPLGNAAKITWYEDDGAEVDDPKLPYHEARAKGFYREIENSKFWPVHCYGMVGVGRNLSPDTGSGAELYTVIGQAPRHLDRNIALVGRIIEGMEHLSSLPRGHGDLGFYSDEEADKRTPILTVRVASDLPEADPASSSEAVGQQTRPHFEYLSTEGETFARYADARANRRDPFFIVPAGGADICNIPVPVRRAAQ